jgi:hypothetical protein
MMEHSSVRVDLVYHLGCPNIERARAMIRSALHAIGAVAEWSEWDRAAPDTPPGLRRFASPTVLVNGRDVDCAEGGEACADADACRVYVDHCGCVCGAPPSALIIEAIRAASACISD